MLMKQARSLGFHIGQSTVEYIGSVPVHGLLVDVLGGSPLNTYTHVSDNRWV